MASTEINISTSLKDLARKNDTMKNNKPNKLILYPQELTPPENYPSIDDQHTKALKINCLFYWKKHTFPNCCGFHKERILDRDLNIDPWSNSGEHLFKAITYTLFFVDNATKDEQGLASLKTYITSIFFSFGTRSPIVDKYVEWTIAILKNRKPIDEAFLKSIIDYLESPDGSKEGTFQQLAEAEQAFNKWLGSLPEDLIPEEVQQNLLLIFFRGIIKSLIDDDEFNAVRRLELNSVDQFLEYLSEITTSILHEIWESIAKGDVNKTIKEASIIDRNKTITEINLTFREYSDQERNYLTIIQQWGNMVSSFIDREIERKKSLTDYLKQEQKVISSNTDKTTQPKELTFPEIFRDLSYYDKFIDLLIKLNLVDKEMVWIDTNKNKMIGIFWGLLNVKNSGRSIFISGPPKPTSYARKIYQHFEIDKTTLCSERYLRDYQKHQKVTFPIKNQFTKELEDAIFPSNP